MSLQQTVTSEAAAFAEKAGVQGKEPVVIANPTDDASNIAATTAILDLLRAQGITVAS